MSAVHDYSLNSSDQTKTYQNSGPLQVRMK